MNLRLIGFLVLLALPGVVSVSWLAVPFLVDGASLPVPIRTLQIVTAMETLVLLLAAASVGDVLGRRVSLRAPLLEEAIGRDEVKRRLKPMLGPAVIGGILGATIIVVSFTLAPQPLLEIQLKRTVPLLVRVLYGGITEEVLVRWGLMSLIAWIGYRVMRKEQGCASAPIVPIAIGISSVAFGLAHLPSIAAQVPKMSMIIAAYITIANSLFGFVAGFLFWRYGLETAIMAHMLAHALAYSVHG